MQATVGQKCGRGRGNPRRRGRGGHGGGKGGGYGKGKSDETPAVDLGKVGESSSPPPPLPLPPQKQAPSAARVAEQLVTDPWTVSALQRPNESEAMAASVLSADERAANLMAQDDELTAVAAIYERAANHLHVRGGRC